MEMDSSTMDWDSVINEYDADERRARRLEMCGKPHYRRKFGTDKLEKFCPRCKEWRLCDFCFQHKVDEEVGKIFIFGELVRIEVENGWETVYRYMYRHDIRYRRFAQGDGDRSTVLLLPRDAEIVCDHFGFRAHRFTVDDRSIKYLLRRIPMGKSITGNLRHDEVEQSRITFKSWGVRIDGCDEGKLFNAWKGICAEFNSCASLAKELGNKLMDGDEVNVDDIMNLVAAFEKDDEAAICALVKRLGEMGEEVGELFAHKQSIMLSELSGILLYEAKVEYREYSDKPSPRSDEKATYLAAYAQLNLPNLALVNV